MKSPVEMEKRERKFISIYLHKDGSRAHQSATAITYTGDDDGLMGFF